MLEAGKVLQNRYVVEKQIGAGGMGTVYLATDKRLASPVAIKETLFTDEDLQRAFEREAQLLNSLRHPALPRVIDYFAEGDAQFIVMEYIAGEDLSEALKVNGAFPVKNVLQWADELLDALDYLHSQKTPVIHRDIKPQNLKLTADGEIVLLDFGLAKGTAGDTSKVTKSNSVFGYSRSYAPLEQIQGTGTDPRSDLYSLAATLYHLLTGKSPTDALTRATAFVSGQPDPLIPVDKFNTQISPAVAHFLHKGLELNAALRPQTAEAMREELQKAVDSPAGLTGNKAKDEEATEISAKKPIAQVVPLVVPPIDTRNQPNAFKVPIQPLNQNNSDEVFYVADEEERPRRSGLAKSVGIAAAILILGGGAAAWYATNQQTAGQNNSNQNANVAISKKTENVNGNSNIKTASSNANTQANIQVNTQAVTEQKAADSSNKNTAAKPPTAVETAEKPTAEKPVETAPAPTPIIVGDAPPTKEIEKDRQGDEPEIIEDDSEDSEERRKRRRRGRDRRDDRPPDTRERRVNDNSSGQRLPTILGAPPNE